MPVRHRRQPDRDHRNPSKRRQAPARRPHAALRPDLSGRQPGRPWLPGHLPMDSLASFARFRDEQLGPALEQRASRQST